MVIDTNNGFKPGGTGNNSARPAGVTPRENAAQSDKSAGRTAQTPQDSVVLSQQAQSMNRLGEAVAELPEVDSERVASLKQAISEGRFEIDAERIAENMLNQDDLLG